MSCVNGVDPISVRIHGKLAGLISDTSDSCIFKVYSQLRKVNEKAYDPVIVAIGPYHCGKNNLRLMEDHKLRYLQLLFQRRTETNVETYIEALRELEGRARRFYAEPISLTTDEFVEMMLLDGCFIIELFRKFKRIDLRDDQCDPIFCLEWMFFDLKRDLLLFENQIPFFLLTKLFEITEVPNQQDNLIDLAMFFFQDSLLPFGRRIIYASSHESLQNIWHLLALVHKSVTPPSVESRIGWNIAVADQYISIPSATELQEAGVKLNKLQSGSLFDIKFNNGVLEIPSLIIEDDTESIFRNLIAYEQYGRNNYLNYVTNYVSFMDDLTNSPKDVKLLRRRGIIEKWLGDDKAISTMFIKLRENVMVSNDCYAQIFGDVNKHCRTRKNVRMANLWHKYFNSLWELSQTIFSVRSYIVPKK